MYARLAKVLIAVQGRSCGFASGCNDGTIVRKGTSVPFPEEKHVVAQCTTLCS